MNMRSARLGVAAAIAAALWCGPAAAAPAAKRHFTFSDHAGIVESHNGFPSIGARLVEAGAMRLRLAGRTRQAAEVRRVEIVGATGNVVRVRGTAVVYVGNGSFKVAVHGTVTIDPDGSEAIAFSGRIEGGTGRYRGATGRLGYAATSATVGGVDAGRGRGTISY
jgi:hypothetical protein